jgi:hypothetical protein
LNGTTICTSGFHVIATSEIDIGGFACRFIELILDLFAVGDIFISFNTSYWIEGICVDDPRLIRLKYMQSWFAVDLLGRYVVYLGRSKLIQHSQFASIPSISLYVEHISGRVLQDS